MSYSSNYETSKETGFRNRVAAAFVDYARIVYTEPVTEPNHGPRVSFAQSVIDDPDGYAAKYALVLTTLGITSQSDDSHILGAVKTMWDYIANIGIR